MDLLVQKHKDYIKLSQQKKYQRIDHIKKSFQNETCKDKFIPFLEERDKLGRLISMSQEKENQNNMKKTEEKKFIPIQHKIKEMRKQSLQFNMDTQVLMRRLNHKNQSLDQNQNLFYDLNNSNLNLKINKKIRNIPKKVDFNITFNRQEKVSIIEEASKIENLKNYQDLNLEKYFNKKYNKNLYISNFSSQPVRKVTKEKTDQQSSYNYFNLLKKIDGDDDIKAPTFNTNSLSHPMDYQKLKEHKKQIYRKFGILKNKF